MNSYETTCLVFFGRRAFFIFRLEDLNAEAVHLAKSINKHFEESRV